MDFLSINGLDVVAVAVLAVSAVMAFFRGFVHEILSVAAWIGAGLAALYGLPYVRPKAREWIPLSVVADAAAAIAIFLVVLLFLSLITRALSKQVQGSPLSALDRSLGFLFGLVRGAVLLSLAYGVMTWIIPDPTARPQWIRTARSLPLMARGGDILYSLVPDDVLADGARVKAAKAHEKARQAIELKRTYDRLTQPRPDADGPSSSGGGKSVSKAPSAPSPTKGKAHSPTYDDKIRQTMNRLIESQQ